VAAAAGALPAAGSIVAARTAGALSPETVEACCHVLRHGDQALLYPQAFKSLPGWLPWAGPLVVFTIVVLSQLGRFRAANLMFWIVFAAAAAMVASVFQAASQLIGVLTGGLPPVAGFVRASSLLMLPLYVLTGQGLTSVFRLARGHYRLLRTVCALAAAAWLIPSDNLRLARHWGYQVAGALMEEESRPRRLQRLQEDADRRRELVAIADWARSSTAGNAVFLADISEFRLLSRRSLVAGAEDGAYLCCSRRDMVLPWRCRLAEQDRLLHPTGGQADPAAISRFVAELAGRQPFAAAGGWYMLIHASAAPPAGATLVQEAAEGWGRFYKVYRVR